MTAIIPSESTSYNVFIVHDDDQWTNETLLTLLDDENITYLSLENDAVPGKSLLENFHFLISKAKKILFIVSEEFCQNVYGQYMVDIAFQVHSTENILTVITTGNLGVKGLGRLRRARTFDANSENFSHELLNEINSYVPEFFEVLSTGTLFDLLFLQGLCLQHFRGEIFGLIVTAYDKYLKVNLDEFSGHLDIHNKYKTAEVCGQCNFLCSVDTSVSLAVNDDVSLGSFSENMINAFANICQHVCDASHIRTNWGIVLSVNGSFTQNHQAIVPHFYKAVFAAINKETEKKVKVFMPVEPDYVEIEKRLASFNNNWDEESLPRANDMAKAGFFLTDKPCFVKCHYCGLNRIPVQKHDEPIRLHAKYTVCPFIKDLFQLDSTPVEKPKESVFPIESYRTLSSRLSTFEKLEISKPTTRNHKTETSKIFADAGFYYKGIDTLLECFTCGLKIIYKDNIVDPLVVHADLSSNCSFILEKKGECFVQTINSVKRLRGSGQTVITFLLKKFDGMHHHKSETTLFNFTF
ncbi:uncharacterized protein LOC128547309 [Mercenaria mercenaria]|uniref:uncharacterized protein LOC128547309 n=1 Tax=Mercenaria mercenaria TaxID=6596 RepID=UPI00234E68EA|nr:uncharacterized protein LOC128547309 [Mercenaria mercenaria]